MWRCLLTIICCSKCMHITTQRRLGNSGRTVLTIIAIRTSAGSTTTPGMEYIGRHTATTVAIESSPFYSQRERDRVLERRERESERNSETNP